MGVHDRVLVTVEARLRLQIAYVSLARGEKESGHVEGSCGQAKVDWTQQCVLLDTSEAEPSDPVSLRAA